MFITIIIIDWAKHLISDCHSSFLLYSHFIFFVFGLQEGVINETAVVPIHVTAKRTHVPGFPFLQRKNPFSAVFRYPH